MTPRYERAFSLIELMVICFVIGLIAALTIPHYAHARSRSRGNDCISNLRKIDAAKDQWAIDYRPTIDATPTLRDLRFYIPRSRFYGTLPFCPADPTNQFDSSYAINNLTTPPGCKINPTNHVLL